MYIAKNFANIINVWWVVITMEFKVKKIEYINKTFRRLKDLNTRCMVLTNQNEVLQFFTDALFYGAMAVECATGQSHA